MFSISTNSNMGLLLLKSPLPASGRGPSSTSGSRFPPPSHSFIQSVARKPSDSVQVIFTGDPESTRRDVEAPKNVEIGKLLFNDVNAGQLRPSAESKDCEDIKSILTAPIVKAFPQPCTGL
jgi:hypothetical protein